MPIRTCIGCRRAAAAGDLVRITLGADGGFVVGGPSRGRGAWVGTGPDCVAAAAPRLGRALRRAVPPPADLIARWPGLLAAIDRVAEPPEWCPRAH